MFSSDFSAFALFTAGLATVVSATGTPASPNGKIEGNPTKTPALNQVVECGKPFDITWTPTTPESTLTIWLCIGPSTNCVIQPVPIADHTANDGSFSWTPSCDLKPTGNSGYGIQLVVDAGAKKGDYQYTPQFGIGGGKSGGSSSASHSASASASASASGGYTSSAVVSSKATYPTGTPGNNTTIVTVHPSKTSDSYPSETASETATETPSSTGNAANIVRGGAGIAMGVVAAFFAL